MSRAELPENMNQAAEAAIRQAAAQHDTAILHLSDFEEVFATPASGEQAIAAGEVRAAETPAYENMSKIQLLKHLSYLDVLVKDDPELKQYMDTTFPDGYKYADPLLRLYSFDSYKSEKGKAQQVSVDEKILEAQQYQIRQLDARKIEAGKNIWAENAAATFVVEMEAQVQAIYQADMEEAYIENDYRMAQARAKIAEKHAAREVESFLETEEFMDACRQANYSITDITSMKPERAAFALRSLMNEWLKNGVLEPKAEEVPVVEIPTPITRIKKAMKAKQAAPTSIEQTVHLPIAEAPEIADSIPVETAEEFRPLTAGARAYAELGEQPRIEAIDVSALGGKVVEHFVIHTKQEKR